MSDAGVGCGGEGEVLLVVEVERSSGAANAVVRAFALGGAGMRGLVAEEEEKSQ